MSQNAEFISVYILYGGIFVNRKLDIRGFIFIYMYIKFMV